MSRQLRLAVRTRGSAQQDREKSFRWSNHIGLLGSVLIPALAMCQVASVAGYDMQVTLAILESAGNTLSIFLRSALATLPSLWLLSIAGWFGFAAAARIDNDPLIYGAMPWLRISGRAVPAILVVLVLASALAPWPYLIIAAVAGIVIFITIFTTNMLVNAATKKLTTKTKASSDTSAFWGAMRRLDDKGNRFVQGPGFKEIIQALLAAGIALLWLTGSPWAPYERLSPATGHVFTGKVVSNDSGELVVITAGSAPELLRLPAESTKRELCHPTLANTARGNDGDSTVANTPSDWPTVLQLVFNVPHFALHPCPTENRPVH